MPAYQVRGADGGEFVCRSFDEFHRAVHAGRVAEDAQVLNQRSGRWMPVRLHPHFTRARHTPLPRRPAPPGPTSPASPPVQPGPPPVAFEFELLELEPEPDQPAGVSRRLPEPAAEFPEDPLPAPPPTFGSSRPWPPALATAPMPEARRGPTGRLRSRTRRGRSKSPVDFRWVIPLLGTAAVAAWLLQSPEPALFRGSEAARTPAAVFHHHRLRVNSSNSPAHDTTAATGPAAVTGALARRYREVYSAAQEEAATALGVVGFPGIFAAGRMAPERLRATRRALAEAGNILRTYRNREIQIEQTFADTALALTRTHAWPPGGEPAWRSHEVLRESFQAGQQMDQLLSRADRLLALLDTLGDFGYQGTRLRFSRRGAAQRYGAARAALVRALADVSPDSAPFSVRMLADGLSHPLPADLVP